MPYTEYEQLDLPKISQEILSYWKDQNIFQKSIEKRKNAPSFIFYEGPPSANGTPGIHHMLSRTIKDIFCRYKTLQGHQVHRKAGWDTHGLPVELQVEKSLNITKEDIGKNISIKDYNALCQETVLKYKAQWHTLTEEMGYWINLHQPYITYEQQYIESLWYIIEQLHQKKLLYKGHAIQPYSPAAGCGLSAHELNQPGCYRNVTDISIVAQFKLKEAENTYFLAWTTTPWTLPANSALAVGKTIDYVKIRTFNRYTYQPIQVILAKEAINRYFQAAHRMQNVNHYQPGDDIIPWDIVEQYTGKKLVGMHYIQLMPYVSPDNFNFSIIAADFVTTEEGTGIVHIAPTFGADDYRVAQQQGIPAITVKNEQGEDVPIVDRQGKFVQEITDYAHLYVKEAYIPANASKKNTALSVDVLIAAQLKKENKAFLVQKYVHSYPHCWRTDKPILYYPLHAWFIKTTSCKKRLIELNKTIHWHPATTGTGRFGHWLENLVDWNISRDRFWGTPLPIWRTKDQKEEKCIGSLKALEKEVEKSFKAGFMEKLLDTNIDLHRPYVDEIILVSDQGKPMYRESDLLDVWFDAGAMPYAQWHYPFENSKEFHKSFPAHFIAEGVDQTRGWFFTLHVLAVLLFDQIAFQHVLAHGLVLDKNGNKMSKRLGNSVDPLQILKKYGPDAIRWYMIGNASPWENLKFDPIGIEEAKRKFFGTLFNTYNFFALYANLDNFQPIKKSDMISATTESDCWILSRLHNLIQYVEAAYETYEPTKVVRTIQYFVINDLSNWYVRLNRKRFWKSEKNADKQAAYETLFTCLYTVSLLASPIAPFYMDKLYQDLHKDIKTACLSVHLTQFPPVHKGYIDQVLEQKMTWTQKITSLVHGLRKKHKIKVRQPLKKLLILITDSYMKEQIITMESLICSEVNIYNVAYTDDVNKIVKKKISPNFPKLGKRYGSKMKNIAQAITQLTQKDIQKLISQTHYNLLLPTQETINITLEEVVITSEDIPGWSVATDGIITVALDTIITDDLLQEGFARELVNRIQRMRKEKGLAIQDKIILSIQQPNNWLIQAINTHQVYICQEIQALKLVYIKNLNNAHSIQIDQYTLDINFHKTNS